MVRRCFERLLAWTVLGMLILLPGAPGRASTIENVTFASLDRDPAAAVELLGELYRPAGSGPFAAVVLLSGCYGVEDIHRQWARHLAGNGYAALIVDGFKPRGVKEVCTDPYRVSLVARIEDAYGAKRYLATRPEIDASRIALAGWSHGGWTLLRAIYPQFFRVGDLIAEAGAFQAAIAIYPYCDISTRFEVPVLVLIGDADDWTPKPLCDQAFAKAGDNPLLDYHVYPGATHSFDDPFGANTTAIKEWMATEPAGTVVLELGGGYRYLGHLITYDAAAHADAKARVLRFLETQMGARQ